jgi:hypothetical protein
MDDAYEMIIAGIPVSSDTDWYRLFAKLWFSLYACMNAKKTENRSSRRLRVAVARRLLTRDYEVGFFEMCWADYRVCERFADQTGSVVNWLKRPHPVLWPSLITWHSSQYAVNEKDWLHVLRRCCTTYFNVALTGGTKRLVSQIARVDNTTG